MFKLGLIFSNHKGTGHKVAHNITTLLNIPLFAWLVYAVISLKDASHAELSSWIAQPINTIAALLFVVVTLTHFTLEIEVVFEDYIADTKKRNLVIKLMKIFWVVLAIISIISILKLGIFSGL